MKVKEKKEKHKPSLKNGSSPRALPTTLLILHSAKISTHNDTIKLPFYSF